MPSCSGSLLVMVLLICEPPWAPCPPTFGALVQLGAYTVVLQQLRVTLLFTVNTIGSLVGSSTATKNQTWEEGRPE